jgi:hypothetical protein
MARLVLLFALVVLAVALAEAQGFPKLPKAYVVKRWISNPTFHDYTTQKAARTSILTDEFIECIDYSTHRATNKKIIKCQQFAAPAGYPKPSAWGCQLQFTCRLGKDPMTTND